MNYGYQGPPVNNFGRPSAPTSFGPPYPTNDSSYPPSNSLYPPSNPCYPPSNPSHPHSMASYPSYNSPCPPSNLSYPSYNSTYPPSNLSYPSYNSTYPPSNPSYPSYNSAYPPNNPSYPSYNSAYPPNNPSYPSYNSTCPPTNPSYLQSRSIGFSEDIMTPNMLCNQIPHENGTIQPGHDYPNPSQQPHYPRQQASYPTLQTHQTSQQFHKAQNPGASWSGLNVPSVLQQSTACFKHSPTVQPCSAFDPRRDAEALRKAMKGFGTDEQILIQILTKRVNSQRQEIALQFKTLFGRDLIKDIKSETSGNFKDLLIALLTPLPQYYAAELHNAMAGLGTKEIVLIEILCTATNHEIRLINDAYQAMYRKRLEDDIRSDTSFNFKRLLVALSLGNRDESSHTDQAAAQADVAQLLRAGELKLGTDESVFHKIFVVTNRSQLQLIFKKYQELTGHSIDKAIEREFSGDIKSALLAIAKSTKDRVEFFAEELHKSMKGCGTDDNTLIRIIVTHCETDLGEIKNRFQSKYSKSLRNWVDNECSGDYKKCLMSLIG